MSPRMPPFDPSSEALAACFDAQPTAVLVVDGATSAIVFANSATVRLLGFEAAELAGRSIDDLVPDQFRARHPKSRAASNGNASALLSQSERVFWTKAGRQLPVSLSVTRVRVGDADYHVASLLDLSGQHETEQETLEQYRRAEDALAVAKKSLSESQEKFEKAFAASPHPICITDVA